MSPHRLCSAPLAAFALALALGIGACRPRISEDDLLLEQKDPACAFTPTAAPLGDDPQRALHGAGDGVGEISSRAPAVRYIAQETGDGFWLRGATARIVMGFAFAALGALAAAYLLATVKKRPPARWGEELGRAVQREAAAVRALAADGDALDQALVARFEEPLRTAVTKAQQLVSRARPLELRHDSATAAAHLESLYTQLSGLLGRVERAHFQIVGWRERRGRDEDAEVERQLQAAVDELARALGEVA